MLEWGGSLRAMRAASQCVAKPIQSCYAIGRSRCVILSEAAQGAAQSKDLSGLMIVVIMSGKSLAFFVPLLRLAFSRPAW